MASDQVHRLCLKWAVALAGGPADDAPVGPLVLQGLTKRYGDVVALDGLDLEVAAGDVFGFVGRNGAGKTTAMRIILGVLAPDAGEVQFGGSPLTFEARRRVGSHASGWRRWLETGDYSSQ